MIFAKVSTSVVRDRINRLVDLVVYSNTHSSTTSSSTEGSSSWWLCYNGDQPTLKARPLYQILGVDWIDDVSRRVRRLPSVWWYILHEGSFNPVLTSLATTTRLLIEQFQIWVTVCVSSVSILVGFYHELGGTCIYVSAFCDNHA